MNATLWSLWIRCVIGVSMAATVAVAPVMAQAESQCSTAGVRFEVTIPESVRSEATTGRLLVALGKTATPEPRTQIGDYRNGLPFFGVDAEQVKPGGTIVIDESSASYPLDSLKDLPAGDYYAQALLNVYTKFQRADGTTIWAHLDQGEGQELTRSPGNLLSQVQKISIDPSRCEVFPLALSQVIPPIKPAADTQWVKHIRIKSEILSKWWGRPIYLGASVVLPKGYDEHADTRYPVLYYQGHFVHNASWIFSSEEVPESEQDRAIRLGRGPVETPYEFYKEWIRDDFPRMFMVMWEHPTPFYDASYAVNSANNGPYGDAITQELMPYIEEQFRIIREPYARVLTGGSTGGWQSLILQVQHPNLFGGAWVFNPDFVDFRAFFLTDLYRDTNAFFAPVGGRSYLGIPELMPERPYFRDGDTGQVLVSLREASQMEAVLGTHARSGTNIDNWSAVFAPMGKDGYPQEIWNKETGVIDRDVVEYMRQNGFDVSEYLRRRWPEIGASLKGKIHMLCPDMDEYYACNAVYLLEDELTKADPPYEGSFTYARRKKHGWRPVSNAGLMRVMADQIERNAPPGTSKAWRYP